MNERQIVLLKNKSAEHNYIIVKRFLSGIELRGFEVKAIRKRRCELSRSYAKFNRSGELYLLELSVTPERLNSFSECLTRKNYRLLLRRKELNSIKNRMKREQSLTLIPLMLLEVRHLIKLELALAKGKKLYDKREVVKRRDTEREVSRFTKQMTRIQRDD